ncbi:helix-turn-helix domain-containing protein [Saccharothrix violaceirubra]|uniref:Excisionase family DNA binding protein n=1 Tax=Saccharothrix violaceirubra TaxID=413306 RepID=A0A7W7T571_9PSEU|nr:helix-turn-helix domain-containing protein [Saccharothrix violaceirubra]MBB4966775.1 excisionase family DNA binding protein [Saccharothrix violaceirubra]
MHHHRDRQTTRVSPVQLDADPTGSPEPAPAEARHAARARLLHTPAQAAHLLAVRESWLRRMAGQQRIPCTLLGKHLRFSDKDLELIVLRGARPAR